MGRMKANMLHSRRKKEIVTLLCSSRWQSKWYVQNNSLTQSG